MFLLWFKFIFCAAGIVYCGTNLSKYADVISEKFGFGRVWVGLILLASITSLPELITGISSVTIAGVPNIALGDIMGSCVFNLSIIALLDIMWGSKPIFSKVEHGHVLSAAFGIILISFASLSILAGHNIPAVGRIGIYTPVIILIYFLGIRSIYFFEKRKIAEYADKKAEDLRYGNISAREAVTKCALNALVIIVAAAYLPFIGNKLAELTGLGNSFVGTTFIAFTTSLPELVVSIAAFRIGAIDMAIANLFGSNMFNIFILAIDDIFYVKGPILTSVSMNHAVTGSIALIMTGIAIVGLTCRFKKKPFLRLGWDTLMLLMACVVNIYLLYVLRARG